MSTPSQQPQNNMPQILERDDVIILSSLETNVCKCGRLRDKVHCPSCGKSKTYGMADTMIAATPNGDIVKGCKVYRCQACGQKFNDIDWYFNCRAPVKIDWEATRARQKQEEQKAKQERWMIRIESGEKFSFNDRMKCKAEIGADPDDLRALMQRAKKL